MVFPVIASKAKTLPWRSGEPMKEPSRKKNVVSPTVFEPFFFLRKRKFLGGTGGGNEGYVYMYIYIYIVFINIFT